MTEGPTEDPTLLKKLEGVKISDEPAMEAAGPSKVKEPTEVKLQDKSPIEFKFPRELNNVLVDTRRLHLFDRYDWYRYHNRHGNIDRNLKLEQHTTEISVIEYGNEVPVSMSWTIDGDGTWIVLKRGLPLNLLISALVPLCHEVEHITIGYCEDMYIHAHGTIKPFIPMRSVLTVCLYLRYSLASLQVILQTISNCFPNATNLELKSMYQEFSRTHGYHFDTTQSSLKNLKLDLCNLTDCGTLDNLFLSISSSCQNIESLTVTSSETLKWDKSSRDITACKLPYLTNIHLESRWLEEHYALQFLADLLHVGRVMSPSLNLVKVESVQLKDIVMKSVEWSRTSTDCGLQIKGAAAAVPITELIDLTTSDLQEITVLTFDSCKIDNFGHCLHQSPQSPKESGTLREIRIFGSKSPLSESDREKLSEVYPNVKVTEKPGSQESSGESHEGARIPSNLDESLFQPSQTSLIGKLILIFFLVITT
ncbi:uncharacterized protein LOC121420616 [Lytechinus variegatus]|uniref:uncharacterized protein LOC121420616 n=1 Tax=Lytechinus variegatus TaxID=7654 RepID=UPI001BB14A61|nr:uncharacterized protein LOC121420616 [Lytechinus variegatus]